MGKPLSPDRVFDFSMDEPEPHLAYTPPSTYEVGGPSTAAEGHSLALLALRFHVPLSMIKDLSVCMGNLEYGYGQLVKKVIQ
nr:hypothetical protein [Tanacetum cinerariifolium]